MCCIQWQTQRELNISLCSFPKPTVRESSQLAGEKILFPEIGGYENRCCWWSNDCWERMRGGLNSRCALKGFCANFEAFWHFFYATLVAIVNSTESELSTATAKHWSPQVVDILSRIGIFLKNPLLQETNKGWWFSFYLMNGDHKREETLHNSLPCNFSCILWILSH